MLFIIIVNYEQNKRVCKTDMSIMTYDTTTLICSSFNYYIRDDFTLKPLKSESS